MDRGILDKSLQRLLTDEPTMLPAWDPMGSLATVGREPDGASRGQGCVFDSAARCRM